MAAKCYIQPIRIIYANSDQIAVPNGSRRIPRTHKSRHCVQLHFSYFLFTAANSDKHGTQTESMQGVWNVLRADEQVFNLQESIPAKMVYSLPCLLLISILILSKFASSFFRAQIYPYFKKH